MKRTCAKANQKWPSGSNQNSCLICHRRITGPRSLLREQIFQFRLREAAGEAFFAQHVSDGFGLALLQFPNFFLHRAGRDEAVCVDGLCLAHAMRAVNSLRLDGRIPPRIVKHHVARVRKIQARARSAQTEQEHAGIRVALERVDNFLPILGLTGEQVRLDVARVTFLLQQREHLDELREHENLLPVLDQRVEQFEQRLRLAARRIAADD